MQMSLVILFCVLAAASALPYDPVIRKLDEDLRHQYVEGPDGSLHLVDLWGTVSDAAEATRYNPDRQNVYHLYTRQNPTVSQPMLIGNEGLLGINNYNPARRTVVLLHGWLDDVTADFNRALVPAFLSAEDVNVIVVDWSAGAGTINYFAAVSNTVTSGESVARFIEWLNSVTGASPTMYHVLGHSLGAHQAGIIGRNVGGRIAYITALDAAYPGWITNDDKFRPSDGVYTEVIHTNAGLLGYIGTLGDADFYPNGGIDMPGCDSQECDHERSFYYMAESLQSGGFTGRRCASFLTAMTGNCFLWGNLRMGGLVPKTGQSGIFYLETNSSPPFSRG
uniref:Pancreatic lipase 2 n=1 Tax=Mamestra configurata TaxID=174822 RepID=B2ZGH7_9NEOP|nr:pancreatic lipase 2 [Mamestra configurata]